MCTSGSVTAASSARSTAPASARSSTRRAGPAAWYSWTRGGAPAGEREGVLGEERAQRPGSFDQLAHRRSVARAELHGHQVLVPRGQASELAAAQHPAAAGQVVV